MPNPFRNRLQQAVNEEEERRRLRAELEDLRSEANVMAEANRLWEALRSPSVTSQQLNALVDQMLRYRSDTRSNQDDDDFDDGFSEEDAIVPDIPERLQRNAVRLCVTCDANINDYSPSEVQCATCYGQSRRRIDESAWNVISGDVTFTITPQPLPPDPQLERLLDEEEERSYENLPLLIAEEEIETRYRDRRHDMPRLVLDPEPANPGSLGDTTYTFWSPHLSSQRDEYERVLSQAYPFLRRHGQGHYSATTLNKVASAYDAYRFRDEEEERSYENLPLLIAAEVPFGYDEETEVKTGGIVGLMVIWPNDKSVVVTNSNYLRMGVGRRMVSKAMTTIGNDPLVLWVGRANQTGHHFALSLGFYPSAMNSTGAVRYETAGHDDE